MTRDIDVDVDNCSDVRLGALVLHERNAASIYRSICSDAVSFRPSGPFRQSSDGLHDRDRARIAQVFETKLNWISIRRQRELVHERFVSKTVLRQAKSAER